MAQDHGSGTTIAMTTSGFNADILTIAHSGLSRESVPTSHLGTSADHTFIPGDLVDWGTLEIGYAHDTDNTATKIPPVSESAAQSITITLPSSKVITGSAFVTDADLFSIGIDERIEGSFTMKISGALTFSTT